MLVYRIETYGGQGVYMSPHYDTLECNSSDRHPAPSEDGLPEEFHWSYQFGFKSLTQLAAWFDATARELWSNHMMKNDIEQDDKLYVSVYDVPADKVMFGGRQMIFVKKAATLISRKLVLSLEDAVLVN